MKLSGLTILRNGVKCGYTFIETIRTLATICDEVIVCEGYSEDNTHDILQQLNIPNLHIHRDHWHKGSFGVEFARITNLGISRCEGDYIFYLQADELIHENDLPKIRQIVDTNEYNSLQFNFVHLRYSIHNKIRDNAYENAIRVIRNRHNIGSMTDGYSFQGNLAPCFDTQLYVYHAGYVFLENILTKMINHAETFYLDNDTYQQRAKISRRLLNQLHSGHQLDINDVHQQLEPYYALVPHGLPIPSLLSPHDGKQAYEPRI